MRTKLLGFLALLGILLVAFLIWRGPELYSRAIWLMMPSEVRPGPTFYPAETLSDTQFDSLARELYAEYAQGKFGLTVSDLKHIEIFRRAGIRTYEGPKTCLRCHKTIRVGDHEEDLMDNLLHSAHYRFFTTEHPNVWGFNGELADNFPMGKIDRPCPKPGSFATTSWASYIVTNHGDTMSEGCGQCHIGGQYGPPLGEMMPGYRTLPEEREAVDCLICHSPEYDMDKRVVVRDPKTGRLRWGQDRSMRAAMTVTRPISQACLRCHQHNFGGDIYVDSAGPSFMPSIVHQGKPYPRVLHPGSKRGTPYSPSWDVHAAAGVQCIDCHTTEGHRIAKGLHTTTVMANDLPQEPVSCTRCHGEAPHKGPLGPYYNAHAQLIACQTCHIPELHPDNATLRDFANPTYEEEEGTYIYTDSLKGTNAYDGGLGYVWWNGDATFLGNPIGENPHYPGRYRFYGPDRPWPEFKDFDYEGWYEEVMRPIAQRKPSKLYVLKWFNGRQHIDLANVGPFGGMYVPYNLATYYRTGNPDSAAKVEEQHPMMAMMYGWMFKVYLMDKFMKFMDIPGWNTSAYSELLEGKGWEPRWIPQTAMLEVDHAIRRDGLTCLDCHSPDGVLDYEQLGYPPEVAERLRNLPELEYLAKAGLLPPRRLNPNVDALSSGER